MTRMNRPTKKLATRWAAMAATVALLGPASLQAQGVNTPATTRPTHPAVTFEGPIYPRQSTALRLSIARETKRLIESDSGRQQTQAPATQGWWSKHKAKVVWVAVLTTIGAIVFTAIFTHTGD